MSENKPVVAFFFGTADLTGAPKMGWYFARSFLRHGYRVVAVVGGRPQKDASVTDLLRDDGVEVIQEEGFEKLWSFALVRRCEKALRERNVALIISVVQLDVKIAAMVAGSLKVPFVLMGQSLTTFYGPKPLRLAKELVFRRLVQRRASLIIAASSAVADQFKRQHGLAPDRVEVIPNSIDTTRFPKRDAVKPPGQRELNLLTVGRLDTQKGQDILFDALASLPPETLSRCTLSLAGGETISSPDSVAFAARLREKAATSKLAGRIKFLGWRNDVPELLSKCDIYVHPARWEGLPLAVLEAMAASAPIIFTDCFGELEGFVQTQHGYRVPVENVAKLRDALERLITLLPPDREEMGRCARELATTHYDIQVIGKRFVTRCEQLLTR